MVLKMARADPAGGGKWQVSDGGGTQPKWSGDGRELFFRTDEGLMSVRVAAEGAGFRAGKPQVVFQGSFLGGLRGILLPGFNFPDYDVSGDGRRFVMFAGETEEQSLPQTLAARADEVGLDEIGGILQIVGGAEVLLNPTRLGLDQIAEGQSAQVGQDLGVEPVDLLLLLGQRLQLLLRRLESGGKAAPRHRGDLLAQTPELTLHPVEGDGRLAQVQLR
jgi:hypothetical protein